MNTIKSLHDKINEAKDLDFGTIFSESIELFKKVWLQGLIITLLSFLMVVPFYVILYLPFIAMGVLNPDGLENGGQFNFAVFIPFYIIGFIVVCFAMIISFGLKAAFFRIIKTKDLNNLNGDDYFFFFKKPYLGRTCKLAVISLGLLILAYVVCVFPIIYMMVPVTIINVIYAFNPDIKSSGIINASFKLGNKKWLLLFGLIIISSMLAAIVGILFCGFGVVVTTAFAYIPVYLVYKKSIGFNQISEIEQIGAN